MSSLQWWRDSGAYSEPCIINRWAESPVCDHVISMWGQSSACVIMWSACGVKVQYMWSCDQHVGLKFSICGCEYATQLYLLTSPSWFILMSVSILPLTEPNPPYSRRRKRAIKPPRLGLYQSHDLEQTSSVIVIATGINLGIIVGQLHTGNHQVVLLVWTPVKWNIADVQ